MTDIDNIAERIADSIREVVRSVGRHSDEEDKGVADELLEAAIVDLIYYLKNEE